MRPQPQPAHRRADHVVMRIGQAAQQQALRLLLGVQGEPGLRAATELRGDRDAHGPSPDVRARAQRDDPRQQRGRSASLQGFDRAPALVGVPVPQRMPQQAIDTEGLPTGAGGALHRGGSQSRSPDSTEPGAAGLPLIPVARGTGLLTRPAAAHRVAVSSSPVGSRSAPVL